MTRFLPLLLLCAATTLGAQATASNRIAGFVADSNGIAVAGADIRVTPVKKAPVWARTDGAGHFVFSALPGGPAQLNVRRLGFHQFNGTIEVGGTNPDSLNVTIYVASTALAAIDVVDISPGDSLAPAEFYARKRENKWGRFLDRAQIEEKQVSTPSELLRGMPGVYLQRAPRFGMLLKIRGCRPTIWVDGVRAGGAELDDVMNMHDLAGIEVYSSLAGLPQQYVDKTNACGAVLVWTRRF
ncbi:MAG: carboxypeptidase regulatory-like domain-containing protein [Gemmatimonadaceae bacterium]